MICACKKISLCLKSSSKYFYDYEHFIIACDDERNKFSDSKKVHILESQYKYKYKKMIFNFAAIFVNKKKNHAYRIVHDADFS